MHEGQAFPCTVWDYKATQKKHLKTHIEAVHEGIKFECKFCGLKFSQEGYLKRHIKSKHAAVAQSKETLDTDYGFKSKKP